ncbi:MAG TPA: hypothetical protein VKF41_04090 [Bryobacteraceae bacterium]|nr:hypothetical protein [Bryobacteraceae bacterium]
MRLRLLRSPIRHPFYPGLPVTLAVECQGPCAGLSGTFRELTRAAAAGARVHRMVFALHYPGTPFLDGSQRDQLWRMFQVPVFAMLSDRNGRLLAYECEAQSGLHVGPQAPWSAGMLESAPCECGRPGPRLVLAAQAVLKPCCLRASSSASSTNTTFSAVEP